MNTQVKSKEMKKISFTECQAVWITYDIELEVSNKDYELLQNIQHLTIQVSPKKH